MGFLLFDVTHERETAFLYAGVERTSPVHTKSRLTIAHGDVETTYYQASENALGAKNASFEPFLY
jgi:hypothetical protein